MEIDQSIFILSQLILKLTIIFLVIFASQNANFFDNSLLRRIFTHDCWSVSELHAHTSVDHCFEAAGSDYIAVEKLAS